MRHLFDPRSFGAFRRLRLVLNAGARAGCVLALFVSSLTLAHAQPPPAAPVTPAIAPAEAPPVETAGYHYRAENRRDPFVSLMARGVETTPTGRRIEGPAGMAVNEISLKGILLSRGEFVAMIKGPDTRTYVVHANEQLLDGTVKSITARMIIMMQNVNDPRSTAKQVEVRKMLRATEDAK